MFNITLKKDQNANSLTNWSYLGKLSAIVTNKAQATINMNQIKNRDNDTIKKAWTGTSYAFNIFDLKINFHRKKL